MSETSTEEDNPVWTFLKGISMGLADIVPGVSGGTIALIEGIYERLIYSIKSIDLRIILYILGAPFNKEYGGKAKQTFQKIDLRFLIPLAIGIVTAFLIAARFIEYALAEYPAYIFSFFFGLILISAWIVYQRIEKINIKTFIPSLIGFSFAFIFVGLNEFVLGHSLPIIFITGFFAICAMILPGISGSFIVLFLGQYEHMLNALSSIRTSWIDVGTFLAGALISLFSFSRLLYYLLEKYHSHTLFFLSGLMIGALRLPFEKVINVPGILQNPTMLIGALLSGAVGLILLLTVEKRRKKIGKETDEKPF